MSNGGHQCVERQGNEHQCIVRQGGEHQCIGRQRNEHQCIARRGGWSPAYRVHNINVIISGHQCIGRQGVGHQYLRAVIGTNWTQGGGPQHEKALVDHSVLGVRGTHRYVSSGGPQSIGRQESQHQCMDVRRVDTSI